MAFWDAPDFAGRLEAKASREASNNWHNERAQMDIDKITIGELKKIQRLLGTQSSVRDDDHWEIGGTYFIRTVTYHLTGRLTKVAEHELVIEDAAWIADDGRFAEAVKSGSFVEVEPFPDGPVIVGRGSLIDARRVTFLAPRSQR